MARPQKIGLDYFPMETDFFERDDVNLLVGEFGWSGAVVYMALLGKIYKNGYFYEWGEDVCLLFCKRMGAGLVPNFVNEVVKGCVRRSLFDKGVFDMFGILTSKDIQETYIEAKQKSKYAQIDERICLLDMKIPQKRELFPKQQELFPQKRELFPNLVHKEKESKEKEKKESVEKNAPTPIFSSFEKFSERVLNADMPMMTPEMRKNFIAYHSERTDWQRMTEDSFAARLMKWVNTEFKSRESGVESREMRVESREQVLSYDAYFAKFRTTDALSGWTKRFVYDDAGNIKATEYVHE